MTAAFLNGHCGARAKTRSSLALALDARVALWHRKFMWFGIILGGGAVLLAKKFMKNSASGLKEDISEIKKKLEEMQVSEKKTKSEKE